MKRLTAAMIDPVCKRSRRSVLAGIFTGHAAFSLVRACTLKHKAESSRVGPEIEQAG